MLNELFVQTQLDFNVSIAIHFCNCQIIAMNISLKNSKTTNDPLVTQLCPNRINNYSNKQLLQFVVSNADGWSKSATNIFHTQTKSIEENSLRNFWLLSFINRFQAGHFHSFHFSNFVFLLIFTCSFINMIHDCIVMHTMGDILSVLSYKEKHIRRFGHF